LGLIHIEEGSSVCLRVQQLNAGNGIESSIRQQTYNSQYSKGQAQLSAQHMAEETIIGSAEAEVPGETLMIWQKHTTRSG